MRFPRFMLCCALALPAGTLCAQAVPSNPSDPFQGTWFGSFAVTNLDGKVSHDTAVVVLERHGNDVTGTAGPSIDHQMPFSGAQITSDSLRFNVDAQGGIAFELHGTADHLEGTATGGTMKATLDLKPAPGLLPHDKLLQENSDADTQMFKAFGACDVDKYKAFLSSDLEFYHDHVGKQDYGQNLEAMRNRCTEGIVLRREIVEGTLSWMRRRASARLKPGRTGSIPNRLTVQSIWTQPRSSPMCGAKLQAVGSWCASSALTITRRLRRRCDEKAPLRG